jgi:hypothetical protein
MESHIKLNERITMLVDIIDTMQMTQQQMYSKIEFLEKRIRLLEEPDYEVQELFDKIRKENESNHCK